MAAPVKISLKRNCTNRVRPPNTLIDLPKGSLPIIGVDPGGVTGWSLLSLPPLVAGKDIWTLKQDQIIANRHLWEHGQIDCKSGDLGELWGSDTLLKLIRQYPGAVVVMESFQLRQMAVDLSPVRIIARVEDSMWRQGRLDQLLYQAPAAKATANDARLKAWGVYTSDGGLSHARDADRHVMIFLRRCLERGSKARVLRETAWPHIYGDGQL